VSDAPAPDGRLVLVRHGETEWSRDGRHTGRTDVPLTPHGEDLSRALAPLLAAFDLTVVLSSPLERARRTAELAGLTPRLDDDLVEWDYGGYEGRSTPEIREGLGRSWTIFDDGVVPGATPGETVEEVAARASRVLGRVVPSLHDGDVALVGHGHFLRILAATFLREEPRLAARLLFDAPAVSILGHDRGIPAVLLWNRGPGA
jgi:broad specificity phosphatase PhoE